MLRRVTDWVSSEVVSKLMPFVCFACFVDAIAGFRLIPIWPTGPERRRLKTIIVRFFQVKNLQEMDQPLPSMRGGTRRSVARSVSRPRWRWLLSAGNQNFFRPWFDFLVRFQISGQDSVCECKCSYRPDHKNHRHSANGCG